MPEWLFLTPFDSGSMILTRIALSLVMILVLWALRVVLCRVVRRKTEILSPDQRRWTRLIKNLIWIFIVLGLVLIWAPQLRTAALSLAAFVVAIVIATKEVILCFTGAFMRVSTVPFRMGDWIRIEGVTGEVVDINPFSAKLQEIDVEYGTYGFTGKIVQIPNARYFTVPIENISHLKQYKPHIFTIAFQDDKVDPAALLAELREITARHTEKLREDMAQSHRRISRQSSIPLPDPAPQVFFSGNDFNNQHFTVRAYLPTRQCAAIASAIQEEFAARLAAARAAIAAQDKSAGEKAADNTLRRDPENPQ